MMVVNVSNQRTFLRGFSLLCVVFGLLTLVMGCSSRQQTAISSRITTEDLQQSMEDLTNSDLEVARLEKSTTEVLKKAHPVEELSNQSNTGESRHVDNVGTVEQDSSHLGNPHPDSLGPKGDVYASSGQSMSRKANVTPPSSLVGSNEKSTLPFSLSDIFFDYDQYMLQEDDIRALETNAKILVARYPKKQLVIQGHCDERGTEEYNMVLGVRRAQAVKDYLVDLGVPQENLHVLSYGKEKPFCHQHSWNCWKHNRRSHFVFQ